ncbi:glycosyltransferase family 25 (LPS biosynthesis protein) [Hirsutella rhossiliensis]|uniref:Glycosyltransferase family 25 (LPS biosynthesis protein) domain-containing protein n=1 Tax=Hirsutella rhossiliensis TaxID=111463 RepID=A0A9P8N5N7_9HYPO|nr:glycosyltransferase family 25 (LPS biosynthesis protein) domain-containing protein [Hirsutella rhossiliensis]KAH0967427.1 glycosyltransferase family 25 (LPS biosynthesis protein) domain-containing protein [Hirsutella rhossiliensis]
MPRTYVPVRTGWAFGVVAFFFVILILHNSRRLAASGSLLQFPTKVKAPETQGQDRLLDDIYNSTLGFEKIMVVSLPSRTDRRDGMVLQSALTHMSIDFIDGLSGSAVPEKAIPKIENMGHIVDAELGSWRGHMNAIQEVIRQNLSSALIMEDDADWDIRLKEQLRGVALATRALTQPLIGYPDAYADPTYPKPANKSASVVTEIPFEKLPRTEPPKISPYGDDWDVFWIGHCGQTFPHNDNLELPKGRVIRHKDVTVPEKKHLESLYIKPFVLKNDYPDHTRAVHHSQWGTCTLGYAISQRGARNILFQLGLKGANAPFDLMLRAFCDGEPGRGKNKCLTTQPSLMEHYRPVGPYKDESDIKSGVEGFRTEGETKMIRWSVRLNTEKLIKGEPDLIDKYPDAEEKKE